MADGSCALPGESIPEPPLAGSPLGGFAGPWLLADGVVGAMQVGSKVVFLAAPFVGVVLADKEAPPAADLRAKPRFLWNSYMLEQLIENKLDPYLLPIIQGSYHNFQAAFGTNIVDVTLVARRCTRRIGTRMWRRGADLEGYVANFVETEQILQANGFTTSFVQVHVLVYILILNEGVRDPYSIDYVLVYILIFNEGVRDPYSIDWGKAKWTIKNMRVTT